MKRLFAANRIITPDLGELKPGVVELEGSSVSRFYQLNGEQPFTEWIGGTISVEKMADGSMQAYKDGVLLKA